MACIYLSRQQAIGPMPNLCIVCGKTATRLKAVTFSWHPGWIWYAFLLVLLITGPFIICPFLIPFLALPLIKRAQAKVPVCNFHRFHWAIGSGVGLSGLVLAFAMAFIAVENGANDYTHFAFFYFFLAWLALSAWLVLLFALQRSMVLAERITKEAIFLKGVSPAFADAMKADSQAPSRSPPGSPLNG